MSDPTASPPSAAPAAARPDLQPIADAIHGQLEAERAAARARQAAADERAESARRRDADYEYLLGAARRQGVVAMRKIARATKADDDIVARVVKTLQAEAAAAAAAPPFDPLAVSGDAGGAARGAAGGEGADEDTVPSRDDATAWTREKNPIRILPETCPVVPIGAAGEVYYYLKPRRELLGVKKHDADTIRKIFGDKVEWLWEHFPKFNEQKGTQSGWKADRAAESLMHACDRRPPFDPLRSLRGVGGWTDDAGGLILHCGDAIYVNGVWREPGLVGDIVYPRAPALPKPLDKGDPGPLVERLAELIDSWSWASALEEGAVGLGDRPLTDGPKLATLISLGYAMAAIAGAALRYRPIVWVTGDAGSGKSALLELLEMTLGGSLLKSPDATAAGIYQTTGRSCVGVAIDEAENDPNSPRLRQMIKLARDATYGARGLRGTDSQTSSAFEIRSAFIFGSILIPPQLPQDLSRTAVLDLSPVSGDVKLTLDKAFLSTAGRALRRRLVDGWGRMAQTAALYDEALVKRGHNRRSCDQWGTLLTLADLALSDRAPHPDDVAALAEALARERIDKSTYVTTNAEAMLNHIASYPVTVFRGGTQMTIGHLAAYGAGVHETDAATPASCRDALQPWGVYIAGWKGEARVVLPNQHAGLLRLFKGTVWDGMPGASGAWAQAMRRLPGVRAENSRRLGGRGWSVPVGVFLQEDDQDRADRAAADAKIRAQNTIMEAL